MKGLVIGYGAIGRRHAGNLATLGHDVVLLRHSRGHAANDRFPEYFDLDEALAMERPDFAVVASPTPRHAEDGARLVERGVPFLLEKPPAADLAATQELHRLLSDRKFDRYDIAFNLRFHPPLQFIHEYLPQLGKIFSVRAAAGYYLPAWRPSVDYRETTSAIRALGGGVHIELVHELDYIIWFLGMPSRVLAHVATVSDLEIDSADVCAALMLYDNGPVVELHLDYLAHKNIRGCQITGQHGTLEWNFVDNVVMLYRAGETPRDVFRLPTDYDFNETYLEELRRFLRVVRGDERPMVDIGQGVRVMQLLDGMIASGASGQWVGL